MTAMVEPPHKYLTLSSRYLFFLLSRFNRAPHERC